MIFIFIFLTSLLLVTFAIPSIIRISVKKRLFDDPKEMRKVHKRIVPNLGGIAIFSAFLFSCSLFINGKMFPEANILMAGGLILFMIGLKDDLTGLGPQVKFLAQFTSAIIVSVVANIRIESLHGFLGVQDLDYYSSIALTSVFLVGIVNAYNLIDGIDGLAGSLGVVLSISYAFLFYEAGEQGWACLSVALAGALIGFLFYNMTPALIFMGDSGSLLLGFIAAVLSIKFMQLTGTGSLKIGEIELQSKLGLVTSLLVIPIFDTLRVFTLRILRNTSPFKADNNHIHHRLLFMGLSHAQSTLILVVINILFVVMALALQKLGDTQLISLIVLVSLASNGIFSIIVERQKKIRVQIAYEKAVSMESKLFSEDVLEKITEN